MSKILLVTGASSDIGNALIRNVSDDFDIVLAHYCHWNDQLERLSGDLKDKLQFFQADFSTADGVHNMIEEIKAQNLEPGYIVHLPAAKMCLQKFSKIKWARFHTDWEISLHSLVGILQAFLPYMKRAKFGKIVLMLTSCTLDSPPKYQSAYTTVKYALLGLMKSLAVEYAGTGITINAVSPDMIQTKFLSELPDMLVEQYSSNRPCKCIFKVEDIIPILAFLLSEKADNINGMNMGIR